MRRVLIAAAGAVVVAAACGGGNGSDIAGCTTVNESVAPDSGVHVIASASVEYASTPPTSGPHAPGPELGLYERILTFPEQVGVLERGDIVVQYDPARASPDDVAEFESFSNDAVVFANPDLEEPLIATAWRVRMECNGPNPGAVSYFIDEHQGQGSPHS